MSDRPSPTPEQIHILDLARTTKDNLMILALAGTGKTTTLEMIEGVVPTKPCLYLCFNKKIATDAEKRMASTTTVRTFNSLGHRIWSKTIGKGFKPEPKKTQEILRAMIADPINKSHKSKLWDNFWQICNGVATAKGIGYIPFGHMKASKRLADRVDLEEALDEVPDDFTTWWIDNVLARSITEAYAGFMDFDDQIYMPTLFGGTFPEFPLVMVDEYQDLNPVNHEMVRKLVRHRLIGVGDPYQSIYEFRGAKHGGMANAVATFSMTECDLSTSFRCPRAIVESVRWHVPKFKWIKPGGHVRILHETQAANVPDQATFICRNNAPLFALAMRMLSSGRSVSVAGSDIGPRLVAQMKRLGSGDLGQAGVLVEIGNWLVAKEAKGSKTAKDTAECMKVFALQGANLTQAIAYAEHLFAQTGKIRFTTGHKAKGLEWDIVYSLDSWLLGDGEQERNLSYVISTRSASQLFFVDSNAVKF